MSELRTQLRAMTPEQLVAEIDRLRGEVAHVAQELRMGKEKNHSQLTGKRRAVATALTILREKKESTSKEN